MNALLERFLSYVKIDTQSDPESQSCPSTGKQLVLARQLLAELKQMGVKTADLDKNGYIMASLDPNIETDIPAIGFIAHYDTSPDFSGTHVNPQVIRNYTGNDITLNDQGMVLSAKTFPDLKKFMGQTLITTDGTTLLGADDKAGVAEIMTVIAYLITHPEVKHGPLKFAFTPDEEIGRGPHKFDVAKFGAQWAYTVDGGEPGELEYENFNAAGASITIRGKSVHPGYAKGKMVNALLIANRLINALPENEIPQKTSGRQGFFHLNQLKGGVSECKLDLIVRDHDKKLFEAKKQQLKDIVSKLNKQYEGAIHLDLKDQYYNMKEKIMPVYHIVDLAEKAMKDLDIDVKLKPIRGGTDGSQLSFMGLPCPNIFAGGINFHGPWEFVTLESMEKAVEVILGIIKHTTAHFGKGQI